MRFRTKAALLFLALLIVFLLFQFPLSRLSGRRQTISLSTTRIAEPLRDDGSVDYLKSVNDRLANGVTPDNNALIALAPWIKMEPMPEPSYQKFLDHSGVKELPEATYLKGALVYLNENYPLDDWSARSDEYSMLMGKPWTQADYPLWAEAIENDMQPLDQIVLHSNLPRYYHPLISDGEYPNSSLISSLLSFAQQLRHAGRELSLRAMYYLGSGETEKAIEDIKAARRLASLNRQSLTLVEQLISNAIDGLAFQCEMALLKHKSADLEQLREYQEFLRAIPSHYSTAVRLDVGERFMILEFMQNANLHGIITAVPGHSEDGAEIARLLCNLLDWNESMRVANRTYDSLVSAANETDPIRRVEKLEQFEAKLKEQEESLRGWRMAAAMISGPKVRGRQIGKLLTQTLLPAVSGVIESDIRTAVQKDMTILAIALELYLDENGAYPEKLEQLVPDFTDQIPIDHFDGQPLRFSSSRSDYILYSVGPDRIDDSGLSYEEREDNRSTFDISVRMSKD